jgi:hypothetical protein
MPGSEGRQHGKVWTRSRAEVKSNLLFGQFGFQRASCCRSVRPLRRRPSSTTRSASQRVQAQVHQHGLSRGRCQWLSTARFAAAALRTVLRVTHQLNIDMWPVPSQAGMVEVSPACASGWCILLQTPQSCLCRCGVFVFGTVLLLITTQLSDSLSSSAFPPFSTHQLMQSRFGVVRPYVCVCVCRSCVCAFVASAPFLAKVFLVLFSLQLEPSTMNSSADFPHQ